MHRSAATRISARRLELLLVVLLCAYYLARLLFFAFVIAPGVPPDEPTHIGIIELYAKAPFLIQDTPESHPLGLVTRVPFLYHLLLGKLTTLNVFGLSTLLFLRLINVAMSMAAVIVAYRLAVRVTESLPVRILFLVMVTNTLMHTFIGAVVSYDNLVNLLAVTGVFSLIAFVQSERPLSLLVLCTTMLLGVLTKVSFLPLAGFLGLILLVDRRAKITSDARALFDLVRSRRPTPLMLTAVAVLGVAASLWLYGGNLIKYGRVDPPCRQVLSVEECMENRIFARSWIVSQYRDDAMSLDEAIRATAEIQHPGDRDHALRLLRNEMAYKQARPEPLPVLDYMSMVWTQAMRPTIFGIQAHQSMFKQPSELLPYNLILLAAFLLWIRGMTWHGPGRVWVYLGCLSLGYFIFLVGFYNYRGYLGHHAPFLGVQGRYLFPVLVPAYLVAARFLLEPFRRAVRIVLLVIVSAVFIYGDLPYFWQNAGDGWFARTNATVHQDLDAE